MTEKRSPTRNSQDLGRKNADLGQDEAALEKTKKEQLDHLGDETEPFDEHEDETDETVDEEE
jgi:hypothetical protein